MRFTAVQCFEKCGVVKDKTPTISSVLMSSYNTPLVTCGLFANINVRTIGPVRFAGKQAGTEADLL